MYLRATRQVSGDCISSLHFDIFIAASGYESRATHAATFVNLAAVDAKVAFGFIDRKENQREDNDRFFLRNKFELIEVGGDETKTSGEMLAEYLSKIDKDVIRIFIDYSCMTRSWYACLISAVIKIRNKKSIECYFGYSPSRFEKPHPPTPNQSVTPIPGFCGLDPMDKPSALIVGLGYEKDRAIGLLEYVDPAVCYAFITDPPLDELYLQVLEDNNRSFINSIGEEGLYKHPLADLQRTSHLLLSLVCGLRENYRVILAPLGVKPLSLICLLLASRFPDVDVWRVTSGAKSVPLERPPLGPLLVLVAEFSDSQSY